MIYGNLDCFVVIGASPTLAIVSLDRHFTSICDEKRKHTLQVEGSDTIPNHVDELWNLKESCEESWNQLESARISQTISIVI